MKYSSSRLSGNALFIILIAVALFAALSYTVTSSSRNGSSISKERGRIIASEIMQYGTELEQAVSSMRVLDGCSDTQISFERSPFDGSDTAYFNPNAPSNKTCHVFHPNGGAVPQNDFNNYKPDTITQDEFVHFSDRACIKDVGTNGADVSSEITFCDNAEDAIDLMIMVRGLEKEVCEAINDAVASSVQIPVEINAHSGSTAHTFKGEYYNGAGGAELADGEGVLNAQPTYCFLSSPITSIMPNVYVYYHVLIAR